MCIGRVMAFKGAKLVVLCCMLMHVSLSADIFLLQANTNSVVFFCTVTHGVSLLLYPLLGIIADSWVSRFKFIKIATLLLLIVSLVLLVLCLTFFIRANLINILPSKASVPMGILIAVSLVAMFLAVGMFEATAIQFGMDQMVEASTDQFSAFIHWYYWSMNIGIGILALLTVVVTSFLNSCKLHVEQGHRSLWESSILVYNLFPITLIQTTSVFMAVLVLVCCKHYFTIEPAGHTPFYTVYSVLRYCWKHKVPERRSAFTYWENDIPPRFDLGKHKYGGPFTTEEVENVKTFFRLFVILLSLFGFHLTDDGYSVMRQLHYKLCPSSAAYIMVPATPNISQTITVLVCVPLLQFIILPRFYQYVPNLLHRMGIGLSMVFFQEVSGIVIVYSSWLYYGDCPNINTVIHNAWASGPIGECLSTHSYVINSNNSCSQFDLHYKYCGGGEDLFLGQIIPIIVRALAYHLVFMSVLEFICAQAPLTMKGLLISVWYALSSLQHFMHSVVSVLIYHDVAWLIFHGVKAFLILLSLITYCCVSKRYVYRVRDEVVNEYYLVQEVCERELILAEQWEQEEIEARRALFGSSSVSTSSYQSISHSSSH